MFLRLQFLRAPTKTEEERSWKPQPAGDDEDCLLKYPREKISEYAAQQTMTATGIIRHNIVERTPVRRYWTLQRFWEASHWCPANCLIRHEWIFLVHQFYRTVVFFGTIRRLRISSVFAYRSNSPRRHISLGRFRHHFVLMLQQFRKCVLMCVILRPFFRFTAPQCCSDHPWEKNLIRIDIF